MRGNYGAKAYDEHAILGRFRRETTAQKWLAREIHDTVANHMVSANLLLGQVQNRQLDEEVRQSLDELNCELSQALRDLRSFCFLLDAPALDDSSCQAALSRLVEGFARRASLNLDFECELNGFDVPDHLQSVVLRILQEALVNVARHSQARQVTVRVIADGETLQLEISDDGRGFTSQHKPGVGLNSMVDRAREIGGDCLIATSAAGTSVRTHLPMEG